MPALSDADLLAEIERRAEGADPMCGPDYHAIVSDLAEEAGLPFEHVRGIWLDSWNMSGVA
ncbi:hypothetical protein [Pseudooceanicola atlanticus]|uniref:Uncharacterized protein n=1 Tax=Pseudooceanicola atlanticus TaxID=1461694 RepID=A0A0A0EKE3_9RHOB|nr:hypothetical protein [Pseudooceanicola atlanticus]KGM50638.1 hypothetical protein ATO9_03935 [Pseudooceanicola atlanticus]